MLKQHTSNTNDVHTSMDHVTLSVRCICARTSGVSWSGATVAPAPLPACACPSYSAQVCVWGGECTNIDAQPCIQKHVQLQPKKHTTTHTALHSKPSPKNTYIPLLQALRPPLQQLLLVVLLVVSTAPAPQPAVPLPVALQPCVKPALLPSAQVRPSSCDAFRFELRYAVLLLHEPCVFNVVYVYAQHWRPVQGKYCRKNMYARKMCLGMKGVCVRVCANTPRTCTMHRLQLWLDHQSAHHTQFANG